MTNSITWKQLLPLLTWEDSCGGITVLSMAGRLGFPCAAVLSQLGVAVRRGVALRLTVPPVVVRKVNRFQRSDRYTLHPVWRERLVVATGCPLLSGEEKQ